MGTIAKDNKKRHFDVIGGPLVDKSPWRPQWLPRIDTAGDFQIPVIHNSGLRSTPIGMCSLHRGAALTSRPDWLIHGYLDDTVLLPLLKNPAGKLNLVSEYLGFVTPDFSITAEMPLQDRIWSVWRSRAVGAYFASRGISVIPNVRWAALDDLTWTLDGIEDCGTIAVSTQGLCSDHQFRDLLADGLRRISERLPSSQLLVYGPTPRTVSDSLGGFKSVQFFSTDYSRVFGRGKF